MVEDGDPPSLGPELEFDMWEGQFEFLGEAFPDIRGPGRKMKNGLKNGYKAKPEWFIELNEDVQMLQQQMSVLADNQTHSDERYTRAKQDNATLQARVLMLEEQLREVETRSEEKLAEQERRHKELVARVDREKQLQVENCAIRLQTLELENSTLREEASRCKAASDRLKVETARLEEQLNENEILITSLREEIANLREQERKSRETLQANQQVIEELSDEIERLRSEQRRTLAELDSRGPGICPSDHENLQSQFLALKEENSRLQEAHDEMQALLLTRSVEEGRSLLTGHQSLAAELEAMSQDEPADVFNKDDKCEVRLALKEQQEVNAQLRAYIDGILLNIVDNYPQLLEVKPAPP
ncbi:unnamed protein product [Nezara viridula]|uniref:FIP-RBD domain-containing protein n=1 Tax=Nezara viridula TaxID=85310 RepID=A0A9P0MQ86_NEZVI|nr:unnamed protein product [Nezara viridula]